MKHMGRRLGIVLAVVSLSAALLLVQSFAAWDVVSGTFAALEHRQGERAIDQALEAIEADLNELAIASHDYAVWDDAVNFVATRDPRFINSNLTAEALTNLRVDFVWMTDKQGADILSMQRDVAHEPVLRIGADVDAIAAIRSDLARLLAHPGAPARSRLFQTRRGLLAVSVNPILRSHGQGASAGTLVFGRLMDHAAILRAQTTSQLPLRLYLATDSLAALPAAARSLWSAPSGGPDRVLVPTSESLLSGFVLLRDVKGAPAALVATSVSRSLASFGRHTGRTLVFIFSCVVAVFATIVMVLLLYLQRIGEARAASERRYRAVITQAHETILLVDTVTRRILEANPAATSTLGFSHKELVEMDIDQLFYACDGDVLKPAYAELHVTSSADRTLLIRGKSKDFIDVEVTASPLVIDERDVTSLVLRDVSARRQAERKLVDNQDRLAYLAHHDMLTGLLNRLGLEHCLPETLDSARQLGTCAAFLYIDLDHFKKVNDLHGHACGDKLLQLAADRLRRCLASDDRIVRMGGDEFVVIASQLRDPAHAEVIAARLRDEIAVPFDIDSKHFKVTASIGVSVFPEHGADYEILLKNADIALYESKEAGRDAYTIFTEDMTRKVGDRLALEVELRDAIHGGQFYLDYQPLVDPKTQHIASLEALVRWRHPVRGRVPPLQFIEAAERTGQICEIGAFVIREACRQIGEWQRTGAQPVPVAINVSSKQLEQRSILNVLKTALASAQISPSLLRIEITESVFLEASDVRVGHLNEMRRMGIEVSVDDFGTGYSNLAYLKHLPVDCLKIDRAFVRDIDAGGADEEIVKAIIRMANGLGLSTVAEGVETQEQARRLRELGATFLQGFYFSPPVAADVCARLLGEKVTPSLDPDVLHQHDLAGARAGILPGE
jgi:diguanylate cyclase (GGDEF)-like protein/PAS domain S-box-containing protein